MDRIRYFDAGSAGEAPEIQKPNKDFTDAGKEFITQSEIRDTAIGIAQKINEELQEGIKIDHVIFHILEPEQIISQLDEAGHPHPLPEELKPFLDKLRKAVLDELQDHLDPSIFSKIQAAVVDVSRAEGRVLELNGRKIFKRGYYEIYRNSSPDQSVIQERWELFQELQALTEKSPHIAYVLIYAELTGKGIREIQKKVEFETLYDLLEDNDRRPPFYEAMLYVMDGMRGNLFLLNHNLALTDNHPRNIAVFADEKRGKLFDLDGLCRKDKIYTQVYGSLATIPPEGARGFASVGESYVTCELGNCLKLLPDYYQNPFTSLKLFKEFSDLTESMTRKNEIDRMPLPEAIRKAESIFEKIAV